uniref:Secreted protein n=1 Tax=Mesocestoides corti TaxID=53468 RepID=A0A5K3FVH7_MESCO
MPADVNTRWWLDFFLHFLFVNFSPSLRVCVMLSSEKCSLGVCVCECGRTGERAHQQYAQALLFFHIHCFRCCAAVDDDDEDDCVRGTPSVPAYLTSHQCRGISR